MQLRKYFGGNKLGVIILLPIAVVAMDDGGGCSQTTTTPRGELDKAQVEALITGNTVKASDQEVYAFVAEDGTLRGLNIANGATAGTWSVKDDGTLCAEWTDGPKPESQCAKLQFFSAEIGYGWGGASLKVVEGNPQDL